MANTATPRKTAAPTKRTPRKAVAATDTTDVAAAENGVSGDAEVTRVTFELERRDDTKSYAVFEPPASSGCVGKLYVPHGTEIVKVMLVG